MGDRCYIEITVHESDAERFEEFISDANYFGKPDEQQESDEGIVFSWYEVNYAGGIGCDNDGFGELPKDIPLYGNHTAGGCYPEGVFVSDGKGSIILCDSISCVPVARIHADESDLDTGEQIKKARAYHDLVAQVDAAWDEMDEAVTA